jgi:hypothetical protein
MGMISGAFRMEFAQYIPAEADNSKGGRFGQGEGGFVSIVTSPACVFRAADRAIGRAKQVAGRAHMRSPAASPR